MITLEHIQAQAGQFALQNLSMDLSAGAFHVLLGPTGSGKTLVLELIAGLFLPAAGRVVVQGADYTHLPPEKRGMAYVPQDNALFPHKNVFQNIAYGLELAERMSGQEIRRKVSEMANALGISDLLERQITGLSGGEQQRVALARALIMERPVLLMDEPTSALHETMQEDFCLLLKALQKQFQLTILMTTHHKDSAFLVADTLHFIENGRLLLSAPAKEVFSLPLPLSVAEILGVRNILEMQLIRQEKGNNSYYCAAMDAMFRLSRNFSQDAETLRIGIRPHDVRVIKEEDRHLPHENAFEARVQTVMFKETDALVQLRTETGFTLMMKLSIYNAKKLGVLEGKRIPCKINEAFASRIV